MRSTVERLDTEALLKTLGNEAPVGICVIQDGRFRYFNSNFPIATGYRAHELLGKDSLEIVAPQDRETVKENTKKMLKGELLSPYEFRVIRKDGSTVWIVGTVKSIRYHDRPATLGSYLEVTERKQTEERLRETEKYYRLIAENVADVIWTASVTSPVRLTYISPSVSRLLGYSVKESMENEMRGIFMPASFMAAMKALAERTGDEKREYGSPHRSRRLEIQLEHKNGALVDVEVNLSLIPGTDGHEDEILAVARDITERRRAEEIRETSEERYRAFTENAGEAIFVVQDGMIRFMNPSGEELSGYSMEELASKPFIEFIHPDDVNMVADHYTRRLKGEPVPTRYEFRIIRKEGSTRWGELNAVSISWEGKPAVLCFMNDVTERKQTEEVLQQSEERYRTILEEMGDGYFETDLAGNLTFVNDALCDLFGYSRQELIGMSYKVLTPEEDVKGVFEAYNRVYRTGEPLRDINRRIIRKDGTYAYAQSSVFAIRSSKGETTGFRGVRHDITERKQAEERLRESEEKYRLLFETSPDCIAQLDRDGRYLAANPATAESLGVPLKELIGRTVFEVMPEDIAQQRFQNMKRVLNEWRPQIFEDERGGRHFHHMLIPLKTPDQREAIQAITRDITETKQAEEAVKRNRQLLESILESAPDGVYLSSLDGVFLYGNRRAEEIIGYTRDELIGSNFLELGVVPEEELEKAARLLESSQAERPTGPDELQLIRRDDSRVWTEINTTTIKRGEETVVIGFVRDITERKEAAEALRRSEERYRTILEEMEDSYFEVDLGGHFTFVNNATCRALGYSQKELISMSYKQFTAQEDVEAVFRVFNEVYRTGIPKRGFCWKTLSKDGTRRLAEHSAFPLRHERGRIIGFRGVGRDMTERRETEEKLRQSTENYRALFDSSVIGTVVLNGETGEILISNEAGAMMLGLGSTKEAIGLNLLDFILGQDRERVLEIARAEPLGQELSHTHEFRAITREGKEIWVSITATRITHEGKLAGLISFADITEQKLQRERLVMTDRLASVGELAAGTAHELNNPLTSIIGFSQLLMQKQVPDDIREDLKLINSEAQRAANVTRNLLTFARKHAPVKQPNQINSVIEDVLGLREHMQKMNGIEVERHLASDLPELMVDYFQMQQVFLNVIINAEYFMIEAHGRGTLTVNTRQQGDTVVVSVTDDGPGIPAEHLARIFDPFFTTKEPGKGTGLGLSICHGIVTEHGGQLYVRSQLGKGATIFVELPVRRS
jgi:PAS domain S-box-containing protein